MLAPLVNAILLVTTDVEKVVVPNGTFKLLIVKTLLVPPLIFESNTITELP